MATNSSVLSKLFSFMVVNKAPKTAVATSPSYKASASASVLTAPNYLDHLSPLTDSRLTSDSRDLLQSMFKTDPDVSAAVGAYLTLANTPTTLLFYNLEGQLDTAGTLQLNQLVTALTNQIDYSQGFSLKPDLSSLCQELRYMLLLRGALGAELVVNKNLVPERVQQVDMKQVVWFEKTNGLPKPVQRVSGQTDISLDIPTFFVAFHRRDPTSLYPQSDFVSAINTIAARQQVINELYRIMQVTGYPRMTFEVVEEVLMKAAPANIKEDPQSLSEWASAQLSSLASNFSTLRSDQPFVHFDSVQPKMLNDKNPGMAVDITAVIEVLNAQNQAGLKVMATVIGRGSGGVNTASVEARIAAMNADQLNIPVRQLLNQVFTFAMNLYGIPGFAKIDFAPAELRPETELEPQLVLRQSRLLKDLSLGLISDDEYHLKMYRRLPPAGAPLLSGTNFDSGKGQTIDPADVSPNGDSLGRSQSAEGAKATKSNSLK